MAAHRYWRLYVSQGSDSPGYPYAYISILELVLATTAGGAQAAMGGTASIVPNTYESSYPIARAFDGVTTGSYTTGVFEGYGPPFVITYDMGAGNDIDVEEMRMYFASDQPALSYPKNFILMYSDDASTWVVRRTWSGQTLTTGVNTFDATDSGITYGGRVLLNIPTIRQNYAENTGPYIYRTLDKPMALKANMTKPAKASPDTGRFYIAGSTTVLGMPFARRVDLVNQKSGVIAASRNTDSTGLFLFNEISEGPWTLVGVDNSAAQNSVIYAHIMADPIP